jgi:hypothetical protein
MALWSWRGNGRRPADLLAALVAVGMHASEVSIRQRPSSTKALGAGHATRARALQHRDLAVPVVMSTWARGPPRRAIPDAWKNIVITRDDNLFFVAERSVSLPVVSRIDTWSNLNIKGGEHAWPFLVLEYSMVARWLLLMMAKAKIVTT